MAGPEQNQNRTAPRVRPRARRCRRILWTALVACLLQISSPILARAARQPGRTQDLIRSAMVLRFCKFVQWPGPPRDDLILGVVGGPDASPDFSSIAGKLVRDAAMVVRPVDSAADMAGCDLLFVAAGQDGNLPEIAELARAESILTIGEFDDFCARGGIIQIVPRRGKFRFYINREMAEQSQLTVSSQLLKMAKIVKGR